MSKKSEGAAAAAEPVSTSDKIDVNDPHAGFVKDAEPAPAIAEGGE
jgi:hypothetical protein